MCRIEQLGQMIKSSDYIIIANKTSKNDTLLAYHEIDSAILWSITKIEYLQRLILACFIYK